MTRLSPALVVTSLLQGAVLTDEMGSNVKMTVFSSRIVRPRRPSGQRVKVDASYVQEEKGRAGVAGSGQVGQSKSET